MGSPLIEMAMLTIFIIIFIPHNSLWGKEERKEMLDCAAEV
jgi:hypothetical protein